MGNQLSSEYELGDQVASGGPNYLWQVYEARNRKSGAAVSLFVASYAHVKERVHSDSAAKRVWAQLQHEFTLLTRCKHPSLLAVSGVTRELGSGSGRMLIAETQPLRASLGNFLGLGLHEFKHTPEAVRAAQDKQLQQAESNENRREQAQWKESSTHGGGGDTEAVRRSKMREGASTLERTVEVKLGVLSVARALAFLHHKAHVVHLNVAPESVYVTRDGTWVLAGLNYATFAEYHQQQQSNDGSALSSSSASSSSSSSSSESAALFHKQEFASSAGSPQLQPPLDYAAPEYVLQRRYSHAADLFSLGVLLYRLHVGAPGLYCCRNNVLTYKATTADLHASLCVDALREDLREAVRGLVRVEVGARLTVRAFLRSPYFGDVNFRTLQYAAAMLDKPDADKAAFLRGLLPLVPNFAEATLARHLLPHLLHELRTDALVPHLVAPLTAVALRLSTPHLHATLLPALLPLFHSRKRAVVTPLLRAAPDLLARLPGHPPLCAATLQLLERVLAPGKPLPLQDAGVRLGVRILPNLSESARTRYLALLHASCLPPFPLQVRRNAVVCIGKLLDGKQVDRSMATLHSLPTLEACLEECSRKLASTSTASVTAPATPTTASAASHAAALPVHLLDAALRVYAGVVTHAQSPARMASTSLGVLCPLLAVSGLSQAHFASVYALCEQLLGAVRRSRAEQDAAAQAQTSAAQRAAAERLSAHVTPSAIGHNELLAKAFEQEADRLATDEERRRGKSRASLTPPSPTTALPPVLPAPAAMAQPATAYAFTAAPTSFSMSSSSVPAAVGVPVPSAPLQPLSLPSMRRPASALPAPRTTIDASMKKETHSVPVPAAEARPPPSQAATVAVASGAATRAAAAAITQAASASSAGAPARSALAAGTAKTFAASTPNSSAAAAGTTSMFAPTFSAAEPSSSSTATAATSSTGAPTFAAFAPASSPITATTSPLALSFSAARPNSATVAAASSATFPPVFAAFPPDSSAGTANSSSFAASASSTFAPPSATLTPQALPFVPFQHPAPAQSSLATVNSFAVFDDSPASNNLGAVAAFGSSAPTSSSTPVSSLTPQPVRSGNLLDF
jgi:SCY1-like protein 2